MRILVQKFGGTSLSTPEARKHAIRQVKHALEQQYRIAVVVSAMGRSGDPYATDTLLQWIRDNGDRLPERETDLLLHCGELISAATMCSLLRSEGLPAVVLTGGQAGIVTNDDFGNAQIVMIEPDRVRALLDAGHVVVVTGFQGRTKSGDITTLGRGGSDTTATALGAALKAERVDIFTDVNGILTADPRIVENAVPLERVSYNEICHLAQNGAKVIHPRAVEMAMQGNIPVRVRSTFSDEEGTLVTAPEAAQGERPVQDRLITGIASVPHITQIQITAPEGQYDLQLAVFKSMAQHRISVDFINVNPSGVVYTVFDSEADRAHEVLHKLGLEARLTRNCAKVSVIGGGMSGVPGIMARIVESLTSKDIPILQSADSHTTIWVLVQGGHMEAAVRSLHDQFQLHLAG
ncbi:aspartokinase [Xylanibacillus composti]|uniref:Aspartokinase n=1 Tax=Xylanibacillus composti TaxID=1572762 RepID=A0A8J4M2I8_9BACL|nr:aspartate kinase [Xylanibacillus composti]GIQ68586.1 aspartokinase [Xylanibacillus composti]